VGFSHRNAHLDTAIGGRDCPLVQVLRRRRHLAFSGRREP